MPSSAAMPAADAPAELHPSSLGEAAAVVAMEKPVQEMTLPQLRDELERTRPAWQADDHADRLRDLPSVRHGSDSTGRKVGADEASAGEESAVADRIAAPAIATGRYGCRIA